jgi:biopolymer transport protein ExbD
MAGKVGGGGGKRGGMQPNSDPNVIPFIDIMLVMLIIFMVAAPPPTVDIWVDLPPPGPVMQNPDQKDKPTVVQLVDYGGTRIIYVDNVLVPEGQLQPNLIRAVQEHNPSIQSNDLATLFTKAKIYVDADQETAYSNVIDVINQIDTVGFKKVSLLVKEAAS